MKSFLPAKKSLGQNFLTDDNIRRKIISSCNILDSETVLEIGPGKGALTQELVINAKSVIAVEKDTRFFEFLSEVFKGYRNLTLINQDILKFTILEKNTKVIGNIPYNITSPLIEHLFSQKKMISVIYLCLQKELAQRMVAEVGCKAYGSFSLFVQYYSVPRILFPIKSTCFRPKPRVDSCFMELQVHRKPLVEVKDEKLMFEIIRACFNQRRKMISNSLRSFFAEEVLSGIFANTKIKSCMRPEQLKLGDFAKLANFIASSTKNNHKSIVY